MASCDRLDILRRRLASVVGLTRPEDEYFGDEGMVSGLAPRASAFSRLFACALVVLRHARFLKSE